MCLKTPKIRSVVQGSPQQIIDQPIPEDVAKPTDVAQQLDDDQRERKRGGLSGLRIGKASSGLNLPGA